MNDNFKMFDDIDMRNNYNRGFWLGTIAGLGSMFGLCLVLGYYFAS